MQSDKRGCDIPRQEKLVGWTGVGVGVSGESGEG